MISRNSVHHRDVESVESDTSTTHDDHSPPPNAPNAHPQAHTSASTPSEASRSCLRRTRGEKSSTGHEYPLGEGMRELFLGSRLNILALGTPIALFGRAFGAHDDTVFAFALIALCPFAERVSWVTEQLATHTNKTLGGLLNATFGNITELVVCINAIHEGLFRLVQLSLIGSILSNLLLVLGTALFVGGLRFKFQTFNKTVASLNSGLLMLASMAVLFPAVLHLADVGDESGDELMVSRFSAVILLCMYTALMFFQLVSHTELFEDDDKEDEEVNHGHPQGRADQAHGAVLSFPVAIVTLVGITSIISGLSDVVVETIKQSAKATGLTGVFISAVVIPIVGNAAEHTAAIVFAYRDELDIALGVAIGSSTQIALLVIPFCVVYAWCFQLRLSMYFEAFETAVLVFAVLTTVVIVNEGRSHYLMGLLLIGAYFIVCAGYLQHRDQELEMEAAQG